MELKNILKVYKKNISLIAGSIITGVIIGIIYFYIPKNFYTTGSLYITRKTEVATTNYFNYDGYYAQQAALTYTNSVLTALNSKDLLVNALEKMGKNVDDKSLKKYQNRITTKKESSQIIRFTVKGNTKEESKDLWNNLVTITTEKLDSINEKSGDTRLSINKVMENPVTNQFYYPMYLCIIFSTIGFTSLSLIFLTVKTYLKEGIK